MKVVFSERLHLRPAGPGDAGFIIRLLNDAEFLRYIGDRGVRTTEQALDYIRNGPKGIASSFGWHLWIITLAADGTPVGSCGLFKRSDGGDVEIGYALAAEFRGRGYMLEAAKALLEHVRNAFGLTRVAAVVRPENAASIRVLQQLGMNQERTLRLEENQPEVILFACAL